MVLLQSNIWVVFIFSSFWLSAFHVLSSDLNFFEFRSVGGARHRHIVQVFSKNWKQKTPDFRNGKLTHQELPLLYWITWNDNADAMLYLPGGGARLFLTDVDHVSFEKANETRQNNLQSATVSLQVVIVLCKRKETAALKIKAAVSNGRVKLSALRRLFFFCRRAAD